MTRVRAPLTCTTDGEWTVIHARPQPLPSRITTVSFGLGACAAAMVALWMDGGFAVWFLAWPLATLPALFLLTAYHDRRRRVQRKPFAVKLGAVRLPNGQIIPSDRMYALNQRNTQTGRTVVIGGSAATVAIGQMGMDTLRLLSHVSYTIELAHDGTSTVLAGGLNEDQANAVATEVSRRTQCFTWDRVAR